MWILFIVLSITIALIHIFSAFTLDRQMQYKQIRYSSEKVSADLDGYRIAFITDTHDISMERLQNVMQKLNASPPDLLVLGGDFPSSPDAVFRSMEILSAVNAKDGIYGVDGNHDHFRDLFAAMKANGITPVSNSGVTVRKHLYLAGTEDLWSRNPDVKKALKGAKSDDFVLLLAHNPDTSMEQDTSDVDLILSGHTHGGHITFFGLWAPALMPKKSITLYGQRFMSGWAKNSIGTDVYTSNGTGYLKSVPRIFSRPQVILLTLESKV